MEVSTLSNKTKAVQSLNVSNPQSLAMLYQDAFGMKPTDVEAQLAARTNYYWWVLYNKVKGIFEIECPDEWDKDMILDTLLLEGRICIADSPLGVLPFKCGPYGQNVFYRPTRVNIANPALTETLDKEIGTECALIYLYDDIVFRNISTDLNIFAQRLASCDSGIDVNIINSKVAWCFLCEDKKQADEAKMIYDKISRGEPAVFYRQNVALADKNSFGFFTNNVQQSYIADKLQAEKRAIYNEFLTQFGVNNAAEEKSERLLVDEVNSNNDELIINMAYAYENIKKGVDKANKLYPEINLAITLPYIDRLQAREDMEMNNLQNFGKESSTNEPDRLSGNMGNKERSGQSDSNGARGNKD